MKNLSKIVFVILLFISQIGFSQYDFLEIKLEFEQALESNPRHQINIALYKQDSIFVIKVNSNTFKKKNSKLYESKSDTIYRITPLQFNKITKMVENLPFKNIFQAMNASDSFIFSHPSSVYLSIGIKWGDRIDFYIISPSSMTKERNLESFLAICKEIFFLAKINSKGIF